MVLPDSRGISRVPHYLGIDWTGRSVFVYGAITLYGAPFQSASTNRRLCNCPPRLRPRLVHPATPDTQRPQALTRIGFGLIPVRSPLLGESLLLSFPRATKMFQFARLPPTALCVQAEVASHYGRVVSQFGYPRVKGCLHLTGAISWLATPFIGSQYQGIHRVP